MNFVIHQAAPLEESLTCELKEAKAQPLQAVGKIVDQYIVAFLNASGGSIYWGIRDDRIVTGLAASAKMRDELKQVIGQKIATIAPGVYPQWISAPFHPVLDVSGVPLPDTWVLEIAVTRPNAAKSLFLTGSGEAFVRTLGGVKKLTGAELLLALAVPLQEKVPLEEAETFVARFPSVCRRAIVVKPLLRNRRLLWVDDVPANNFYERVALAELEITCDVATTTAEALHMRKFKPDLIVSDMERHGNDKAGLDLLMALRSQGAETPVVFYVGRVLRNLGLPLGAFGITDTPNDLMHLIFDVLERAG